MAEMEVFMAHGSSKFAFIQEIKEEYERTVIAAQGIDKKEEKYYDAKEEYNQQDNVEPEEEKAEVMIINTK